MAKHELDDVVQWHHLDVNDVVERLETDQHRGLTVEEVGRRLAREGPTAFRRRASGRPGYVFSFSSTTF